ncbi:MAG: pyridoxamine 5'-phosphate oxidase family protein, partial [Gaiellaceae bacterium]
MRASCRAGTSPVARSRLAPLPRAPLPAELVEFLKRPHAAVISTVRSDGAPYSAATWYDWDDGRVLVNMDHERLRLSHMR